MALEYSAGWKLVFLSLYPSLFHMLLSRQLTRFSRNCGLSSRTPLSNQEPLGYYAIVSHGTVGLITRFSHASAVLCPNDGNYFRRRDGFHTTVQMLTLAVLS